MAADCEGESSFQPAADPGFWFERGLDPVRSARMGLIDCRQRGALQGSTYASAVQRLSERHLYITRPFGTDSPSRIGSTDSIFWANGYDELHGVSQLDDFCPPARVADERVPCGRGVYDGDAARPTLLASCVSRLSTDTGMRHALLLCAVVAAAGAAALHSGAADATAGRRPGQWGDRYPESKHSTASEHRNRIVPSSAVAAPPAWRRTLKESRTPESNTAPPPPAASPPNATDGNNGSSADGRWVWADYNATTEKINLGDRMALAGDGCPKGRIRITSSLCIQPE
ncbi:hypothetical protein EVAR_59120_1 [Eumeta japonica]|uniref:Uncharacterized protein n=1 Tax=Eumeta variegata TaxID=151549 RepID=A0A4C1ZJC2_EUMVA|nr:hypothetical protein EVAR_59120_1 [Eumeta japonica]